MNCEECITVIVPVYNSELYLSECISSVLNQSYKKIELLLIDDGSTDKSPIICDKYERIDNRVRVIHQNNMGVSAARNAGLDLAKGEYICFVDSDDTLKEDALKIMFTMLKNTGADMAVCGFSTSVETPKVMENTSIVLNSKELMLEIMRDSNIYAHYAVWSRLYYAKHLKNIRFSEQYSTCEDAVFSAEVLSVINNCVCSNIEVYVYRILEDSLSHNRCIRFPDVLQAREAEIEIIEKNGWNELAIERKLMFKSDLLYYLLNTNDEKTRRLIKSFLVNIKVSVKEILCIDINVANKMKMIIKSYCGILFLLIYSIKYRKDGLTIKYEE